MLDPTTTRRNRKKTDNSELLVINSHDNPPVCGWVVRTSPRKYVTAVNVAETLEENYRAAALLQPHLPATGGVAPSCRHRGCVRQLPNTLLIPRGVIYYSEKHAVEANLLRVHDCMPIKLTVVEKTAVGPINLPASLTFKWLVKKQNIFYVTVQIMTFWHMWKTTYMLSETGSLRFKKHICSIWSKPDGYNFLCYSFLHTNSNSLFVCFISWCFHSQSLVLSKVFSFWKGVFPCHFHRGYLIRSCWIIGFFSWLPSSVKDFDSV